MYAHICISPSILSDLGYLFAMTKLISAAFPPANIEFLFEKQLAVKSGGYSFSRRPCKLVFWSVLLVSLFILSIHSMGAVYRGKSWTDPSQVSNFCLTGDSCLPASSPVGFPRKSAVLLLLMNHIGFLIVTSESWLSTLVLMMLKAIIIVILGCGRLACVSWDVSGSWFLSIGCR